MERDIPRQRPTAAPERPAIFPNPEIERPIPQRRPYRPRRAHHSSRCTSRSALRAGLGRRCPVAGRASPPSSTRQSPSARPADDFRILGVLGRLYILMENADGLVLVDQHAAHERILFEELRRRMETQGVPAQRLLMPVTMQLAPTRQRLGRAESGHAAKDGHRHRVLRRRHMEDRRPPAISEGQRSARRYSARSSMNCARPAPPPPGCAWART